MLMVKGRREGLQVRVEIGPDVVLHPLAGAEHGKARAEPGQTVSHGEQHDDENVVTERSVGTVAVHEPDESDRITVEPASELPAPSGADMSWKY